MTFRNGLRALTVAAFFATSIIVGCGGGGGVKTSLPPATGGLNTTQKVGATFTVTISGSQTQSTTSKKPALIPTNTQSLVIEVSGTNPNATPVPGAAPPSNATVAGTVNVTASTTNPPPPGQCYANNGAYTCTVTVQLPVGTVNIFVLAYSGQNGTGSVLANGVVVASVSANGAVTQPGTSNPIAVTLITGTAVGTLSFTLSQIVPTGIYNPNATPTSYPNTSGPLVYSSPAAITVADPNGSPIPTGTKMGPVGITDSDTSGATCLVYIPNGASSASPCPFATSASTIYLSTSGDTFAVLYNGKNIPNATISVSAVLPGVSPGPSPVAVTIAGVVPVAAATASPRPAGAMLYDSAGATIYAGMNSNTVPLYAMSYSASTGYGTPAAVPVTTVNGSPGSLSATQAGGGVNAMTIGPDGNIWIAEHSCRNCQQYVAVAAIHSAVVNPLTGSMISPGSGVFAEYRLESIGPPDSPCCNGGGSPLHSIASLGGFIWVMDRDGDIWRISPTTGLVSPNRNPGYAPAGSETYTLSITDPTGTTYQTPSSRRNVNHTFLAPIGTKLYFASGNYNSLNALSLDTSTTPSTGICSPAGPEPCIATFQQTLAGSVTAPVMGGMTDGSNYWVINDTSHKVLKITPPSTVVTSAGAFDGLEAGGLIMTADGWLWALSGNGAEALSSMTSTAAPFQAPAQPSCATYFSPGYNPGSYGLRRGAQPFVVGPDGTLFVSPNEHNHTGTFSAICAVVY